MESNQTNWEQILRAKEKGISLDSARMKMLLETLSPEELELIDNLENDGLLFRSVNLMNQVDEDQAWKELNLQPLTKKLYPSWIRYAAAALIPVFAIAALYYWSNKQPGTTANDFSKLAATDHKRATLVLANGEELGLNQQTALSKLKNVQGANVENLDSTALKYTANQTIQASTQFNELRVPRGGEYKLVLADGTQVWVNAESKLRFPVNFNGATTREVYLEGGEAYFKVSKNKEVPFIVHSGSMAIKVLGTSFNVNTYSKNIKTTLVEGHVQINAGSKSLDLLPDQQATFNVQSANLSKENIDVEADVAWKDGWMIFQSSELKDVMEQLGRWYDYNIVFESERLKQVHFGGKLRKYNEVGTLLSIIEKTNSVNIEVRNQTIYIKEIPKNQ
ncbi:FecR family protein [Pedobacter sp. MC2016-24]|uniref:FecR family protein n=1 Tax=Pedobacter sp. MC2016-24 TaxID=2780090 RepID=UPI001881BD8A|nr:FecR domain-containing protein [Pedobacter sp. MC2016-24]MBE9599328.1 FecR domain-containing protein [Pedobacter sp. MC2016-24]